MPILIWLKLGAAAAMLGGLVWLVDEIGDRREAKVRAEYNKKIDDANARSAEAERRWSTHYAIDAEQRNKLLADLSKITAGEGCGPAPALLLEKLNAIQPRWKK